MLTRWIALLPGVPTAAVEAVGHDLLDRYAEPARRYHDGRHLAEVLDAVDRLAAHAARPDVVRLAAWFHDAVYDPQAAAGANEAASADLAREVLARLRQPNELVEEVGRLVEMTALHDPAGRDAVVLSDADLAILASGADRYAAYAADVRAEYAHVPDPQFRAGRAEILRSFAERPRIYLTSTGYAAWEQPARANLAAELEALARP